MTFRIDGMDSETSDHILGDDVVAAMRSLGSEDGDGRIVLPNADEMGSAYETYAVYRWSLPDGRSLFIDWAHGGVVSGGVDDGDIRGRLRGWNHDDVPEEAEWMAAWGYGGLAYLEKADEAFEGPCRVWCEPNYYVGTYAAPLPHFVRADEADEGCFDESIREFSTYAEASEYVDEYYNAPSAYDGIAACSVLAHGQAGPDSLTIVKA